MKRIHFFTVLLLAFVLFASSVMMSYATTNSSIAQSTRSDNSYEPLNNRYYYRVVEIYQNSYSRYVSQSEAASAQNYEKAIKTIAGLASLPLSWYGDFCSQIMNFWTTPMSREGTYSIAKYKLERRQYDRLKNTYTVVNTGNKFIVSHKGQSTTYQYWLK